MTRLSRLLEYDVGPEFSDRVRRFVRSPLGILTVAAAVAGLCGLAVHPRVFALAGGLVAVAAAGVCWPWVTARGVRAAVRFDRDRTVEGGEVGAVVAVSNHLPWPAWGLTVRLGDGPPVRLPTVPGRTRGSYRWAFVPPGRGDYPASPPAVRTAFPFGVWTASREVAVDGRLVAWPRTVPVGPPPTVDNEAAEDGPAARPRPGGSGDLLGVRPYRRGDSPRRVHWPQSAKHDRLVVCEFQSHARPAALVVVDVDPAAHTAGPDGSREWAVRVAASLAKGWADAGAEVGLAWAGGFVPPAAGAAHTAKLLDALARIPAGGRPLADVLAAPAVRAVRAGVTVAVTSDAGRDRAGRWPGVRWVVLDRAGFAADPSAGPVSPKPMGRAWVDLRSADDVAHHLRHKSAEAAYVG